jgi:hypothetical protein
VINDRDNRTFVGTNLCVRLDCINGNLEQLVSKEVLIARTKFEYFRIGDTVCTFGGDEPSPQVIAVRSGFG